MKFRPIIIVASIAALGACNRGAANNSGTANTATPATSGAATGAATPATPSATADPQLAAQLSMAAQAMSAQLPMTQQTPNGAVTFESMVANGNELVTTMSLPMDLTEATFGQQFGAQLPVQACSNPQMVQLVSRGAVITYVVKDSEGEEFRASVSSC